MDLAMRTNPDNAGPRVKSGRPAKLRSRAGAWLGVVCLVALAGGVTPSAGRATPGFDYCTRASHVRLSIITGASAFTGGSYPVYLVLHNVGKSECSVEGHPLVVVGPHRFPVVVGDVASFDRNDPYIGPERVLHLQPGGSVRAEVVIGRRCDGAKSEMTAGTVTFSYGPSVSLRIQACRKEGVAVYTSPFRAAT